MKGKTTKKTTAKNETATVTVTPNADISLEHLTKIEGHASLHLKIEHGKIVELALFSEEGARFFEGLVIGRNYDDTVEMTSRICGICSTAHITAALRALEEAIATHPSRQAQLIREFMAIGERIRSHATHLYFLALPDYLGFESALEMAPKHKKEVMDALALIKLGNTIIETFGGRQIHPVGAVIGGSTLTPKPEHLAILKPLLAEGKKQAWRALELFAKLPYPRFERKTEYFCLRPERDWPLLTGDIVGSDGKSFKDDEYQTYFSEYMTPRGTSKFVVKQGKSFRVGALARINLGAKKLPAKIVALLKRNKITFPSHNPFHTNVAQAIELLFWIERAEEILTRTAFTEQKEPFDVKPVAGRGIGAVEAPRGILYHDYVVDKDGYVRKANIVTPTVQNLKAMEDDIRAFVPQLLKLPKEQIALEIEKLIRAYDPCFSCSTHFVVVEKD